jgi:hypothetical protein
MAEAIMLVNIQKPFKKAEWPAKLVCKRCKVEKEAEAFVKDIKLKDGRKNRCRECDKEVREENRLAKRPSSAEYFDF